MSSDNNLGFTASQSGIGTPVPLERSPEQVEQMMAPTGANLRTQQFWAAVNNNGAEMLRQELELNYLKDQAAKAQEKYLSQEELKKKYPSIDWKDPLPESVADMIAQRNELRDSLSTSIGLAKPGVTSNLIVGALTMPLDPVGMAAGWGIGKAVGVAGGALFGKSLTKLGLNKYASSATASYLMRTATNFAENMAGYAAIKAGSDAVLRDYQYSPEFTEGLSINAGAALFMSALSGLAHSQVEQAKLPPEAQKQAALQTEMHLANNVKPNIDNIIWDGTYINDGGVATNQPGGIGYKPLHEKSNIFVNQEAGGTVSNGPYGVGVYGSDSVLPRNARGDFYSGEMKPGTKLFDLDADSINTGQFELKKQINEKLGLKTGPKGQTFKEYLDSLQAEEIAGNIPTDYMDTVQQTLAEQGYQGFSETHKVNGNSRYNKVFLFDKANYAEGQFVRHNPDMIPSRTPEELQALHKQYLSDVTNRIDYEEGVIQKISELKDKPGATPQEIQASLKEANVRTFADLKQFVESIRNTETQMEMKLLGGRTRDTGLRPHPVEQPKGQVSMELPVAKTPQSFQELSDYVHDPVNQKRLMDNISDPESQKILKGIEENLAKEIAAKNAPEKPLRGSLPSEALAKLAAMKEKLPFRSSADLLPEERTAILEKVLEKTGGNELNSLRSKIVKGLDKELRAQFGNEVQLSFDMADPNVGKQLGFDPILAVLPKEYIADLVPPPAPEGITPNIGVKPIETTPIKETTTPLTEVQKVQEFITPKKAQEAKTPMTVEIEKGISEIEKEKSIGRKKIDSLKKLAKCASGSTT